MTSAKQCDVCGAIFQARSVRECYCSNDCYAIGNGRKTIARLRRKLSDSKFREEFYKKKKLTFIPVNARAHRSKPCMVCGNAFSPIKRFSQKYCSKRCATAAILARSKRYKQTEAARQKSRLRNKARRNTDPHYVLKRLVSRAIWGALKKTGQGKVGSSFRFLPYSPVQLKVHLESFFNNTNRFSWDNHGKSWHIDHVIPQSMFHYTTMDCKEFRDCWALSNLMPAPIRFNGEKGNRHVGTINDHGQLVFLAS